MPNLFLPPIEQGRHHAKEDVTFLGDAWNIHYPLTGGGMTVTLSDVVLLMPMLAAVLVFSKGWRTRAGMATGLWRVRVRVPHLQPFDDPYP